jgi:hypothetical protein
VRTGLFAHRETSTAATCSRARSRSGPADGTWPRHRSAPCCCCPARSPDRQTPTREWRARRLRARETRPCAWKPPCVVGGPFPLGHGVETCFRAIGDAEAGRTLSARAHFLRPPRQSPPADAPGVPSRGIGPHGPLRSGVDTRTTPRWVSRVERVSGRPARAPSATGRCCFPCKGALPASRSRMDATPIASDGWFASALADRSSPDPCRHGNRSSRSSSSPHNGAASPPASATRSVAR